ncbi:ABC transporter permease [Tannockella kyphosi]|uniref:ABC transporter permease n=1 Tax=Tannockella kyphosi TaxID=2899121 RepID=UPI0020116126|nr:ABC transporter permease [Tannockella kyphosi]
MVIFHFMFDQMLLFCIPLLVVALAGLFSERSGVVNIALEGIMIFGAFIGILLMYFLQTYEILSGQALLLVCILAAAIAGGLFSLFHAVASVSFGADQTISGTALNLLAPAIGVFVAKLIFNGTDSISFKNEFIISRVPVLTDIPFIGELLFTNFYLTTFLGIFILIGTWFFFYKTKFGLRMRACGEFPQAADAAGINVGKMRYLGVIISGVLAGVGGIIYVIPVTTSFDSQVAGYGFLALAVLIFGNWKPWRIATASVFFAICKTISTTYVIVPVLLNSGISPTYYKLLPYVATLILLAFTSKNSAAPKACGEPYDKSKR